MNTDIQVAVIAALSALFGSILGHLLTLRELTREKQFDNRAIMLPKIIDAYATLYGLLSPGVHTHKDEEKVVIVHEDASYINKAVAEAMFNAISTFIASKDGAFIGSAELIQKVLADTRDYIQKAIAEGEPQPNGWVKVANKKAKGAQDALNWARRKTLDQLSTRKMPRLKSEMGLPE